MLHVLILAAGLGTRLKPLTEKIAKPLIPIVDNSPLARQVALAKELGAGKIHANAHHLAEQLEKIAPELGIDKIWKEAELLGTGGPINRLWKEEISHSYNSNSPSQEADELLVLNGDCEHNLNVKKFLEEARKSGEQCALLAINNPQINTLCLDRNGRLIGIANKFSTARQTETTAPSQTKIAASPQSSQTEQAKNATFTGISWYSSKALAKIKESDWDVRDFWQHLCENGENPSVIVQSGKWIDIGSPNGLMQAIDNRLKELDEKITPPNFTAAGSAGSGRMYYRMKAGEHSLILQTQSSTFADEQAKAAADLDFERFVRYGNLFSKLGLPTPEIYAVSESEKRVVMEDLGSVRLYDAKQPLLYYPQVLEKLIMWQEAGEKAFAADAELAARVFDEKDYLWETSYFAENYLLGYLSNTGGKYEMNSFTNGNFSWESANDFFTHLAKKCSVQPRTLMHRDFQSQNIMLGSGNSDRYNRQGEATQTKPLQIRFIDFQGVRNGSVYYDAASLLWDPYMMIPSETVGHLFKLFHSANPLISSIPFETAWEDFLSTSLQRIMQALGAYCFLSKKKGIKEFEKYIEPGIKRLKEITAILKVTIFGNIWSLNET